MFPSCVFERMSAAGCLCLRCQLLQNLLAEFLRLAEKLLVLGEHAIEFQRFFWLEPFAQNHIPQVHGIG